MSITARMRVSTLLEQHPDAEEVFETYGIEIDSHARRMTLDELCREEAINYWELKSDIALAEGWDGAGPSFGDADDEWDEDEEEEAGPRGRGDADEDDGEEEEEVDEDDWDEEAGDDDWGD